MTFSIKYLGGLRTVSIVVDSTDEDEILSAMRAAGVISKTGDAFFGNSDGRLDRVGAELRGLVHYDDGREEMFVKITRTA
jgi:hypothetical protein